jgi:hypothetical protein
MIDDHLQLLAHPVRRRVLSRILADDAVRVPQGISGPDADSETLALQLLHVHLPKLAAAGIIELDRERSRVTEGDEFREIRPLLEALVDAGYIDDSTPIRLPSRRE